MINSSEDVLSYINDKSFKKIFILCGRKSFVTSGAENFLKKINNCKIKLLYKKSEIPILEELIEIIKEVKNFKPDLFLAIGGGAVIDYAKIANVVDVRPDISDLIINYTYPFKKKFTKLAVIPTTAGSGAEVTSNAVIYVHGIKYSFESELLIPDNFFLIPEFLISAPNNVKASSGFDAIAQALESLISQKSNNQSINFATKSLEISVDNFNKFLKKPDYENAAKMSIASHLAGKAINISKTTAPHAISYPFSSFFKIRHGHAVSLFFESFFAFNFKNSDKSQVLFDLRKRYELIFKIFGVNSINDFNSKIKDIKKTAGLEDDLKKLNIDIQKKSSTIIKGVNLLRLKNNPVKINENDIFKIITKQNL
jgi:alcohol dehydrogenase class IV